jgi:hypothetical protein
VWFNLPALPSPQCLVQVAGRQDQSLQTQLDTVIINTDEMRLFLIWRTHLVLRSGPHDVRSIKIWAPGVSAPLRAQQP